MYNFIREIQDIEDFVKGVCIEEDQKRYIKALEISKALYLFCSSDCSFCKNVSVDVSHAPCCNCIMLGIDGQSESFENNFEFNDSIAPSDFC